MKFPVFETFHSFQGEGDFAGKSAFFIRLFGCPLRCSWCDSSGTWNENSREKIELVSAEILAKKAAGTRPDFVVLTGGEPAIHELSALCDALHSENLKVHIETSGAFKIRGNVDWITLSPKKAKFPLLGNLREANELKLIISEKSDLEFWAKKIRGNALSANSIWLHPEWSQRKNAEILSAISDFVRERGAPFRAGWQIHKLYNVD